MKSDRPTLADVAQLAGVSPATAARVIHQNGYASEKNRKKVETAIEKSGYRPNLQARSLRMRRSYTLGLVLTLARENPFFTKISHAVRTAAMDAGYSLLTVNHGYSEIIERQGVRQFLEHDVEAVILCHGFKPENFEPIVAANIPIIQLERRLIPGAHLVSIDPTPGMKSAVENLVGQGHRRIAFIGGSNSPENTSGEMEPREESARVEAFKFAGRLFGLNADSCPIRLGSYSIPIRPGTLPGYEIAKTMFSSKERPVTAVIAGSDVLAAGILQALHDLNIHVPRDVSLIGYDDSLSQFLTPPLTSVAQPYVDIANAAMELIVLATNNANSQVLNTRVATNLIHRKSVMNI